MRSLLRCLLSLAAVGLAAPAPVAQAPPPPGSFGFMAFTMTSPNFGGSDAYVLVDLNTFPSGTVSSAAVQLQSLQVPFGASPALIAARTVNSRRMQAPTETRLAMSFDPASPFPIVWIQATDPLGNPWLAYFDYRAGFPPTHGALPLAGPTVAGQGSPYDVLVHSNGRVYATHMDTAGNLVVDAISYIGLPAPVVGASFNTARPPSPFVTVLTEDSGSGNVAAASASAIHVLSPGLGLVGSVLAPNGFVIGTNVEPRFGAPTAGSLVAGLRPVTAASGGHGWLSVSGQTGTLFSVATNPFGNAPGSGNPWILAAGFNDIASTSITGGPVAPLLLNDPGNIFTGAGLVAYIQNNGTAVVIPNPTLNPISVGANPPFGNPEVVPSTPGAFAFMLGGGIDFGAVVFTTGVGTGTVSAQATSGFVTPATVDRPLALPGGFEFCINNSGGNIDVFPVGASSLGPPAPLPTQGTATTLPNVLSGGLAGPQPVYIQGFQQGDEMVVSAPVAPAAFGSHAIPVAVNTALAGGLVLVPSTTPPATFGARQSGFNFVNGSATSIRMLFPVTFPNPAPMSLIDVVDVVSSTAPFPAAGAWKPPTLSLLTSEVLQL